MKVPKLWEPLVGIVIPVVLFVMMAMSIVKILTNGYEDSPSSYLLIFGWVPWRSRSLRP